MQAVKDSLELNLLWTELHKRLVNLRLINFYSIFSQKIVSHLSQSLNNGETHWFNVKATLFPFCTSCKENDVFIDNE